MGSLISELVTYCVTGVRIYFLYSIIDRYLHLSMNPRFIIVLDPL
jgi:hypothetical protein